MTRITILGSGFAALTAVRELRRRRVEAEIVVVSPTDRLIYLPSLIWIPTGLRRGEDLVIPLAGFFQRHRVTWHQAMVERVEDGGRRVVTSNGTLETDHLIIATGGRFLRSLPGIEHALIPCASVEAAEAIRQRVAALDGGTIAFGFSTNPAEPGAVRGGPMFEFLFGLDTHLRQTGRRERFKLVFFNPSAEPGQRLGPRAVGGLLNEMRRRGIETHLGHKLVRFEPDAVVTAGGTVPADLILFLPGLTGPAWMEGSDLPRSAGGFIAADAGCRVLERENVYVVGDAGSYPGPDWMPRQAHQADLHAQTAARNLAATIAGGSADATFLPELICIVDMLDQGMMVFRNKRFNFLLPRSRIFHWMKRAFERHYLRQYRTSSSYT